VLLLEIFIVGIGLSLGFIATIWHPCLRAGGNLVVGRSVWMLLTMLKILIIVVTVRVVISVLLWSKLVHLLRTRSKLTWATIPSHGHYTYSQ
jgi:hypothetical protein